MNNINNSELLLIEKPFHFFNNPLRSAIHSSGEVWFCAKDIFECLGIAWSGKKTSLPDIEESDLLVLKLKTSNGINDTFFVPEFVVYLVAFRSNKPEAIKFRKWIAKDVLPQIRKFGGYGAVTRSEMVQLIRLKMAIMKDIEKASQEHKQLLQLDLQFVCMQLGQQMPNMKALANTDSQLALQGV